MFIHKLVAEIYLGEQIWVGVSVKRSQPKVPRALGICYRTGARFEANTNWGTIRNTLAMSHMVGRVGFLGPTYEPNYGSFSKRSQ